MLESEAGSDAISPSLPASLLAVRARCLNWVVGTLGHFDPRTAEPQVSGSHLSGSQDRLYAHKAFAELCLAAYLLLRFEQPSAIPAPVAALVREVCADAGFIRAARLNPFGVLAYVYPALLDRLLHTGADTLGSDPGGELYRFVAGVLRSPALLSTERVPHRIADILFGRWLFTGHPADQEALRRPWRVSNGEYLPHAAVNGLEDFYAYTHNVFYVAGFGLFQEREPAWTQQPLPMPAGLDPDGQDFALWRFAAEGNWDIALELVMAQMLLCRRATAGSVAVLARMLADAETLGFLSGPPPRLARGESRFSPEAGQWRRHYHTTLVGVICCTLAVRPWARPFLASLAQVDPACSMGAMLASGKLLSDVQHRRRTGKRELRSRLDALQSCAGLDDRFDRFLGQVPGEFRTWQR